MGWGDMWVAAASLLPLAWPLRGASHRHSQKVGLGLTPSAQSALVVGLCCGGLCQHVVSVMACCLLQCTVSVAMFIGFGVPAPRSGATSLFLVSCRRPWCSAIVPEQRSCF